MINKRNRTPSSYIGYGLYLYFLGLAYRSTAKALNRFVHRSHMYQSGNGYKNTNHNKKYPAKEKRNVN
jgi:hypothetical protein